MPQSQTREGEDPSMLMADAKERELARAVRAMGLAWVNDVSVARLPATSIKLSAYRLRRGRFSSIL